MGSGLSKEPWRHVPQENLDFLKRYQPKHKQANHLRILLHGPVGAGKSSFINSVSSLFQDRITGIALTDAQSHASFTKKYTTHKIHKDPENFCSFVINDMMGIEQNTNCGVHVEDLKLALKGHVRDGYQFKPAKQLDKDSSFYNSKPTLDDKVHVLVTVIPAGLVSLLSDEVLKKMREVRLAASDLGIPQLAILTKVDEACPKAKDNINNVYKSKYLKQQVDQLKALLGLQVNCIFLVRNYESEITPNDGINRLMLCALRQMINFGEDFLNNAPAEDRHPAEAKVA